MELTFDEDTEGCLIGCESILFQHDGVLGLVLYARLLDLEVGVVGQRHDARTRVLAHLSPGPVDANTRLRLPLQVQLELDDEVFA